MSIPGWINDAQTFSNNDNGNFMPNGDFMQTSTASPFDFNQIQNQHLQQQQRMQNGDVRNGSPAFHNSMYQTQPMIPSKRPRPREDSIGASPQQHPGILPGSRSQTPQQPYPGMQGSVNGNQQYTGVPSYQQFQPPSNHAGQSPVVQNQGFNPQAPQQRVHTMSPSPYPQSASNFAGHASPPSSDHGSRVNTPQNGAAQYPQSIPYGTTPSQTFAQPVASTANGGGLAQYGQHLQNQQQQQQLRINEARNRQLQQQRHQAGPMNSMGQPQGQMTPQQIEAYRIQQAHLARQRPNNPEQLSRNITNWAQQNGQEFNPQPFIGGRLISSVNLFMGVMRFGGSKRVTAAGQWASVANFLQIHPSQQIPAAQDLQRFWHMQLSGYEQYFSMQQHQKRMTEAQRSQGQAQGPEMVARPELFSPTRPVANQSSQQMMQPPHVQNHYPTSTKHAVPQSLDSRQPVQNGYITPQPGHNRSSSLYGTNQPPVQVANRAPSLHDGPKPSTSSRKHKETEKKEYLYPPRLDAATVGTNYEPKADIEEGGIARTYGGIELEPRHFVETVDYLLKYKLNTPKVEELGLLDVRAMTLSLRSGLHAEVRLSLDTLATISKEKHPETALLLENCDDLIETIIDCADDQVQLLAEHSAEVSDEMLVNSYEETIRGCRAENGTLHDPPEYGTLEHDLDRAVERLICIVTILRNLSFIPPNQILLADAIVIRFLATVIRYIGTRSMLLRTHQNILDFSKDVLVFLSNVSHVVDLPGKEEALCILHFLLSFAPIPPPHLTEEEGVISFSSYTASTHRYYPHAVDCMAKLLARGDPNRSLFRFLFAAESASSPPYELLTRSFGLAIAAIPEIGKFNLAVINTRAPCMMQGLLAAEILASLIPNTENDLARLWLASQDGFALSLMRISNELPRLPPPQQSTRQPPGRQIDPDPYGHAAISERGLAVLRKLAERIRDADGRSKRLPHGLIPDKRSVMSALMHPNLPSYVTRHLCALSSMDN